MASTDDVAEVERALTAAFTRLRFAGANSDPHVLQAAGRLHIRLQAIRAVKIRDAKSAKLLASGLRREIEQAFPPDDVPVPLAAAHARIGARLLGVL
ncbi:hypothetical protein [Sphingomonas elodea]|uniref:hypothetical protein n=1 Tax=Sphingomonas elodea TaxID=179878 RepID=UPI0002630D18|nr:hypothetical protein [Sphingomonas elodea]